MRQPLTQFPEGMGYAEHVWDELSKSARTMLDELDRGVELSSSWPPTLRALERRELITYARSGPLTERGRWLIRWARKTGRWS